MSDELEDRYRWCVFCGADCWVSPEFQSHADDCPSVTGVFPVRGEELGGLCESCGEPSRSMGCCRCDHTFSLGEHYHRLRIPDTDDSMPGYEVVCAGCAAHAELSGSREGEE